MQGRDGGCRDGVHEEEGLRTGMEGVRWEWEVQG